MQFSDPLLKAVLENHTQFNDTQDFRDSIQDHLRHEEEYQKLAEKYPIPEHLKGNQLAEVFYPLLCDDIYNGN